MYLGNVAKTLSMLMLVRQTFELANHLVYSSHKHAQ